MNILYIVNLSGGYDSTAATILQFEESLKQTSNESHFFFCYNNVMNNFNKIIKERNSINLTVNLLKRELRNKEIRNVSILDASFDMEFEVRNFRSNIGLCVQPILWPLFLPFHVNNGLSRKILNYDKVYVIYGYIHGDDYWHFRKESEEMLLNSLSYLSLGRQEIYDLREKIRFLYPLEWVTKNDVMGHYETMTLLKECREWVWTCENPTSLGGVCGYCKPCLELKKTVSSKATELGFEIAKIYDPVIGDAVQERTVDEVNEDNPINSDGEYKDSGCGI